MLRKDLLVRQFEEFGKVMAQILGYKKQEDFKKFEEEINAAARKFTPFEIAVVENMTQGEFDKNIIGHPDVLPEQYRMLADLLFERIKFFIEQGDENKVPHLVTKCRQLYKKFSDNFTHNEFNLDVHYKLKFLDQISRD